jgi:hypothetical protein
MDRLDQYIESLIAERARVNTEIARLEGMVRSSRHHGTSGPRRKSAGRAAVSSITTSAIGVPSSRQSSDRV